MRDIVDNDCGTGGITMTAEQLRQHIKAVPFSPFHVRTIDGCRISVLNRDFILMALRVLWW